MTARRWSGTRRTQARARTRRQECGEPASVRRETHHLVLVLVYLEAEIRGKCRVQQAERMRIPDLAQQRQVGSAVRPAFTVTNRQRGPFADAVGCENRRAPG